MKRRIVYDFRGMMFPVPKIKLYNKRKFLSVVNRVLQTEVGVHRTVYLEPSILAGLKVIGISNRMPISALIKMAVINQYGFEINSILPQLKLQDDGK